MTNHPSTGLLPSEFVSFVVERGDRAVLGRGAPSTGSSLPRCTNCGTFRFPPAAFCWVCRQQDVEWIEHDGNGELYSFTVIRHAVIPGSPRRCRS